MANSLDQLANLLCDDGDAFILAAVRTRFSRSSAAVDDPIQSRTTTVLITTSVHEPMQKSSLLMLVKMPHLRAHCRLSKKLWTA